MIMLSILASPIVAKIMSGLTVGLILTSAFFAVAYYREKSVTVTAQAKLSSVLTLAEQAQRAAEESRLAASKLNSELGVSNRLLGLAMGQQQQAEAKAAEVAEKYVQATKDPKTFKWDGTPLPDNVVRLFRKAGTDNAGAGKDGPPAGDTTVYQDRAAASH